MNEPHNQIEPAAFGQTRIIPIHSLEPSTDAAQATALNKNEPGANPSEPVRTSADQFEQVWLTVEEAVTYCTEQGLSRTAKTLRKWAERSYKIPEGEVVSDREDTLWGRYRWKIERASLERKVAEELGRERATQGEPVQTGAHFHADVRSKDAATASPHPSEPVRTRANAPAKAASEISNAPKAAPPLGATEPVRTGSHDDVTGEQLATLRAENRALREQQKRDREEIGFLREEVTFNRSLKTDLAQNSHRLLETLETMAIGGRLERPTQKQPTEPVRYQPDLRPSDEV